MAILNNDNRTTTIVNRNTPLAVDSSGFATFPSGFTIVEMICINSRGAEYNIAPLVKSFTITEEIFSPILVLSLKVRDVQNFFESFALNGEEKIYLHVKRETKIGGSIQDEFFQLSFAVKEYPNYSKSAQQPNAQEYDIVAVSDFGYVSMLSKISMAVNGNPIENIIKIFREKLRTEAEVIGNACVTAFRGIVTISSPLKAIEWLRGKAFDEKGSPFFVYTNMYKNDVVQIRSLADMWKKSNPIMRKYEYRQLVVNHPGNIEASYAENATRILDMRSNIRLDKLDQSIRGAFASVTTSTDAANKSIAKETFNLKDNESVNSSLLNPVLGFVQDTILSRAFKGSSTSNIRDEKPKNLGESPNASLTNISTNSNSFGGGESNSNSIRGGAAAQAKSFYALFEAVNHQIIVYGDFKLSVGKKIRIEIPKSINPEEIVKEGYDHIDKSMSGEYIIAVAAHIFADGRYTTKLKLIRNAL